MVMIIKREKSLKFISIKHRGKLNLVPIGEGVSLNPRFELKYKNAQLDIGRIEFAKERYNYHMKLKDADMSQFDKEFVELFRSGAIVIYGKEWALKHLYLEHGSYNNKTVNIITNLYDTDDFHDLLTDKNMPEFKRDSIMGLFISKFFYDLYVLCKRKDLFKDNKLFITADIKNQVLEMIEKYDGKTQHDKTPETFYSKM